MRYQDIDTLLIGVRDWFVRRINNEYSDQKADVVKCIEPLTANSNFKKAAIVDADLVGKGELLIVPNQLLLRTLAPRAGE